jgi:hypothetical protein
VILAVDIDPGAQGAGRKAGGDGAWGAGFAALCPLFNCALAFCLARDERMSGLCTQWPVLSSRVWPVLPARSFASSPRAEAAVWAPTTNRYSTELRDSLNLASDRDLTPKKSHSISV